MGAFNFPVLFLAAVTVVVALLALLWTGFSAGASFLIAFIVGLNALFLIDAVLGLAGRRK